MPIVRCTVEAGDDSTPLVKLSYAVKGEWGLEYLVGETIGLQTTRPNYGGQRWWFSCPRMVGGKECGRRVGKIYRAPGSRRFACRRCLDLSYESCQKSHRYDGILARMADDASGVTFEFLKQAFSCQAKEARRRQATPPPKLSDAFREMLKGRENR
jgi:hypothetical protein